MAKTEEARQLAAAPSSSRALLCAFAKLLTTLSIPAGL